MLVISSQQVQAPISKLTLSALRQWGLHVDYFSNRINQNLCEPGGIILGGKGSYIPIGVKPMGGGAEDRVFCVV